MNRMEQNPAHEPHKPCRSCIDFKSWSKQQRNTLNSKADVSDKKRDEITGFEGGAFKLL